MGADPVDLRGKIGSEFVFKKCTADGEGPGSRTADLVQAGEAVNAACQTDRRIHRLDKGPDQLRRITRIAVYQQIDAAGTPGQTCPGLGN